jgi:DNA invertase Pin-like site-specific DNA recombinase
VTGTDAMGSVFLKLLSVFAEFYAKQVSEKSKATNKRMIKENYSTLVVLDHKLGMMLTIMVI